VAAASSPCAAHGPLPCRSQTAGHPASLASRRERETTYWKRTGEEETLRTGNERVRKRQKEEEIKKGRTKRKGK
jgi:hypothetical protein